MISFTPSLHSLFGTKVVMGNLGFIFNCRGDYFSLVPGHANALAPGKRPRSTLQGTLVLKDGQPFLLTGSPGADDQCMRTMQTLLNIVEFGMNMQQAIEAPRWSTRSFPASPFPHTMYPATSRWKAASRIRCAPSWSTGPQGDHARPLVDERQRGDYGGSRNPHGERGADPRTAALALAW